MVEGLANRWGLEHSQGEEKGAQHWRYGLGTNVFVGARHCLLLAVLAVGLIVSAWQGRSLRRLREGK